MEERKFNSSLFNSDFDLFSNRDPYINKKHPNVNSINRSKNNPLNLSLEHRSRLIKDAKEKVKQRSNERYKLSKPEENYEFDSPTRFSVNSKPEQPIDYLRESNPFSDLSQK